MVFSCGRLLQQPPNHLFPLRKKKTNKNGKPSTSWHCPGIHSPAKLFLLLDYKQRLEYQAQTRPLWDQDQMKQSKAISSFCPAQTKLGHCTSHRTENTHFPTEWMMAVSIPGREMPLLSETSNMEWSPISLDPPRSYPAGFFQPGSNTLSQKCLVTYAVCVLRLWWVIHQLVQPQVVFPPEGTDSAQHGPNVLVILSAYVFLISFN